MQRWGKELLARDLARVELKSGRPNPLPTASKTTHFIGHFSGMEPVKPTASTGFMERAMGVERKSAIENT
jgi:hypothetical protein